MALYDIVYAITTQHPHNLKSSQLLMTIDMARSDWKLYFAGFSGHANYCAANAIVDMQAESFMSRGIPSTAVQWGAWSSVGECGNKNLANYH